MEPLPWWVTWVLACLPSGAVLLPPPSGVEGLSICILFKLHRVEQGVELRYHLEFNENLLKGFLQRIETRLSISVF